MTGPPPGPSVTWTLGAARRNGRRQDQGDLGQTGDDEGGAEAASVGKEPADQGAEGDSAPDDRPDDVADPPHQRSRDVPLPQ